MLTYVPIPDAVETASLLHDSELVEAMTGASRILDEMHRDGDPTPFSLSPYFKMWYGHAPALAAYALALTDEIERRGFWGTATQQSLPETQEALTSHLEAATSADYTLEYPRWWGDYSLHNAHKSALLRIRPERYYVYWPTISMEIIEYWPAA